MRRAKRPSHRETSVKPRTAATGGTPFAENNVGLSIGVRPWRDRAERAVMVRDEAGLGRATWRHWAELRLRARLPGTASLRSSGVEALLKAAGGSPVARSTIWTAVIFELHK